MHPAARFVVGLLLYLLIAGTVSNFGQSLGDIARKERERRAVEQAHSRHVYTNEDLLRPQILQPEDRAHAESPAHVPSDTSVTISKPVSKPVSKPAIEPAPTVPANAVQVSRKARQFPFKWKVAKKVG